MVGVYFNGFECDLLIPLLVSKINSLYTCSGLSDQESEDCFVLRKKYEEMLARIYISKNIGV